MVIVALLSLAWVIFESGAFLVEIRQRLRRRLPVLAEAAAEARAAIDRGDRAAAASALDGVAWSGAMSTVLAALRRGRPAGRRAADRQAARRLRLRLASGGSAGPGCWSASARRSG